MTKITRHIADKQVIIEFVPPGCTGFIQVADVGLIMPVKDYIKIKYADHFREQLEYLIKKNQNPEYVISAPKKATRGRPSTKISMGYKNKL